MTSGGSFKRGVRSQARKTGMRYTQVLAEMQAGDAKPVPARTPVEVSLPVSLAHVLLDLARAFHVAGEDAGEQLSVVLWANLLRVIPEEGVPLSDLPAAARISRRAVKAWFGLEKRGWLELDVAARGGKIVRLTDVGRRARDRWAAIVAETERSWSDEKPGVLALRSALEGLVAQFDLELPHYSMTYGSADTRATGGAAVRAKPGPPRVPAHGTDWVPVIRSDAGSVRDLPLHALLSQALMAFTIDYEEQSSVAMAVAAMLCRTMPTGSTGVSALPTVLGVNGSGRSSLERHGVVSVSGSGNHREATLTTVGERIRDAHERIVGTVTESWRGRYGQLFTELRASLGDVEKRVGDGLPHQVLVRYCAGRGFVDVSFSTTE